VLLIVAVSALIFCTSTAFLCLFILIHAILFYKEWLQR
jgi:hypothetical protein